MLAQGSATGNHGGGMQAGTEWRADRLLVLVKRDTVTYLAGSTMYEQDLAGFREDELSSYSRGSPRWLMLWSRHELPFSMSLAGTLAWVGPESPSARFFFERFGSFYCGHRTDIELAARELRYILDGLFALIRFPELFTMCMESMGPSARESLPKGVTACDLGFFLGRMMTGSPGDRICTGGLPVVVRAFVDSPSEEAAEVWREPHLYRAMEKLERSAERAAPVIERLRAAW